MEFEPERIQKCASIKIDRPVEETFPLFGPVREKEWAEGWDPEIIYSTTNLVEERMVFKTRARHLSERTSTEQEDFYTWVIIHYDPKMYGIEYMVSTSNRIWFIRVSCEPEGSSTHVQICYTYTGLNEAGNQLNREAMKKMFANDLKDWEVAINHYLKHGKLLTH